MAMTKAEINEWLEAFEDDDLFGIDEGGLCLMLIGHKRPIKAVIQLARNFKDAYLEIGGIPEEEENGE